MVAHRGLLFLLSPRESLLLGFSVLYHTISSCCHHAKAVFLAVLFVYLFVFARSTMSLNHESHLNVCFLFSPREPCFLLFSLQVRMGARVDAAAPAFLKKYLTAKRAVEKRLQEVGKTLRSPPLFPPPPLPQFLKKYLTAKRARWRSGCTRWEPDEALPHSGMDPSLL